MNRSIVTSCCLFLIGASGHCAEVVIVRAPDDLAHVYGDSASDAPFALWSSDSMRYQQVYSSTTFSSLPPGGGDIRGIILRGDQGARQVWGGKISTIEIELSSTTKPVDSLSAVFASNVGADRTVVFTRGSTITAEVFARFGPEQATTFAILFNQPFHYDPSKGNLLLDVRTYAGIDWQYSTDEQKPMLDAADRPNDGVSRVFARDVNAGVAETVDSLGLYTVFSLDVVPEPSSVGLLLLGTVSLFVLASRSRSPGRPTRASRPDSAPPITQMPSRNEPR